MLPRDWSAVEWYTQAMNSQESWHSLACRGDNDVNHDEKDHEFTPEDLELIKLGMEEIKRRGLHNLSLDRVETMGRNGYLAQDDVDLYIDVHRANPVHMAPKWYDRVEGLNRLRERFNG